MIITVGVIGPVYINIAKGSFVIAEGRSLLKATPAQSQLFEVRKLLVSIALFFITYVNCYTENNDSKNNLIYGISHRPFGENLWKTTLRVKKHLGDIEFKALETQFKTAGDSVHLNNLVIQALYPISRAISSHFQ